MTLSSIELTCSCSSCGWWNNSDCSQYQPCITRSSDTRCDILEWSASSPCTNEPSGEDLCTGWMVEVNKVQKGLDLGIVWLDWVSRVDGLLVTMVDSDSCSFTKSCNTFWSLTPCLQPLCYVCVNVCNFCVLSPSWSRGTCIVQPLRNYNQNPVFVA